MLRLRIASPMCHIFCLLFDIYAVLGNVALLMFINAELLGNGGVFASQLKSKKKKKNTVGNDFCLCFFSIPAGISVLCSPK